MNDPNSKVLVTGATGFIGSRLLNSLSASSMYWEPVAGIRAKSQKADALQCAEFVVLGDLEDYACIAQTMLKDISVVIHTAARAHVEPFSDSDSRDYFSRVNVEATLALARNAALAGVQRFIFLSSIGVNGIASTKPFTFADVPAPVEDYARSKLEAEIGLREIAVASGMEVVVIRPPLVYGKNAPGNFQKLTKLVSKNLPLPLGAINNKKSFVALDNLVDLVITCIDHPQAANQTFLVSDDHDVSTTELLRLMTNSVGKHTRLLPIPMSVVKWGATAFGKKAIFDRLCGSLQVDITHTRETLGWAPPVTMKEGIRRCFVAD